MFNPSPAGATSWLESLPPELLESIICLLPVRDMIALAKYVQPGSFLANVFANSPTWKPIWAIYMENGDEFQTIIATRNVAPPGLDPVELSKISGFEDVGALDSLRLENPSKEFLRRLVKIQTWIYTNRSQGYFPGDVVCAEWTVEYVLREFSSNLDKWTLSYFCQEISTDAIEILAPWLMREPSKLPLRLRFFNTFRAGCKHAAMSGLAYSETDQRVVSPITREHRCKDKHGEGNPQLWTLSQILVFLEAYSGVQKRFKKAKAQQLRDLAALYERHHSRLKMPRAPPTPRENPKHIAQQLEATARLVDRIDDLGWGISPLTPRTKVGDSRFLYPHACLIPYNWCLRLWVDVLSGRARGGIGLEVNDNDDEPAAIDEAEESAEFPVVRRTIPEHIKPRLDTAREGLERYHIFQEMPSPYKRLFPMKVIGMNLFRIAPRINQDPDNGTLKFAVYGAGVMDTNDSNVNAHFPPTQEEIDWLTAFVDVVEWMESEFPSHAQHAKEIHEVLHEDVIPAWVYNETELWGSPFHTV